VGDVPVLEHAEGLVDADQLAHEVLDLDSVVVVTCA